MILWGLFNNIRLHRLARRDEMPIQVHLPAPGQHRVAGELRAVVADDHSRRAASLNDGGELASDATSRDGGVGDRTQTLLGDIVDDVEDAEPPAIGELILDEVERPARIGLGLHHDGRASSQGLAPGPPLADGEALFAVEPMDAIDA
jgi:hypothetical protein